MAKEDVDKVETDEEIKQSIENTPSEFQTLTFEKLLSYYASKGLKRNLNQLKKSLGFYNSDKKYNVLAQLLSDDSHVSVRLAVYFGTSVEDKIYSVRDFGNQCLLYTLDELLNYGDVLNIMQAIKASKDSNTDVPLFDGEAFKQAIINSFLYSNWVDGNGPMVSVYSDRIEILSRGTSISSTFNKENFISEDLPFSNKLAKLFDQLHIINQDDDRISKLVTTYGLDAFEFYENSIVEKIPFNWFNSLDSHVTESKSTTNTKKDKKTKNLVKVLSLVAIGLSALLFKDVFKDKQPPVVSGVKDITVELGDPILYRQGVEAIDAKDGQVELQVDTSFVDTSKAGTYVVSYWAVDNDGNKSDVVTANVTIEEPPVWASAETLPTIDENSELYLYASNIYNSIVKETDTPYQKAEAIWTWCRYNIIYVGHADKVTWQDGALYGFKYYRGDCWTFYSCAKALLSLANIESIDVVKIKMEGRSNHYWCLVNIGNEWYHFDTCPRTGADGRTFFMYTDEQMLAFSETHNDCFDFDLRLYPRTPGTISDKYLIKFYPELFDENGNRIVDTTN